MVVLARGLKGWIIALLILGAVVVFLALAFSFLLLLLPLLIIIAIVGYLFRMLRKSKKPDKKKDVFDVEFKVKE